MVHCALHNGEGDVFLSNGGGFVAVADFWFFGNYPSVHRGVSRERVLGCGLTDDTNFLIF